MNCGNPKPIAVTVRHFANEGEDKSRARCKTAAAAASAAAACSE